MSLISYGSPLVRVAHTRQTSLRAVAAGGLDVAVAPFAHHPLVEGSEAGIELSGRHSPPDRRRDTTLVVLLLVIGLDGGTIEAGLRGTAPDRIRFSRGVCRGTWRFLTVRGRPVSQT